jgi:regulator of protease activity HflC (stomatin/prohibitin superfamily)
VGAPHPRSAPSGSRGCGCARRKTLTHNPDARNVRGSNDCRSQLVILYAIFTSFYVVEEGFTMIVERCGRFSKRCSAGLHFLVPFVDRPRPLLWRTTQVILHPRADGSFSQTLKIQQSSIAKIDMRENLMDFPNQPIITRDNVQIDVHPALFYRIIDARRAVYETYDLDHAVSKLVQTALRSIIGDMGLDDTLASREEIGRGLESRIKGICWDWGLDIIAVELLEVSPTLDIQRAMHSQLKAERIRRADIVTAEGTRQRQKTESEGSAQAAISMAQGTARVEVIEATAKAKARELLAQAEGDALREVARSLDEFGEDSTRFMIGLKYIEAFRALALSAGKREVYFPFQGDIMGALADLVGSKSA